MAAAAAWSAPELRSAEPGQGLQLTAGHTEISDRTGETVLSDKPELREEDLLITADEFRYLRPKDGNPESITARGHVVYTRGAVRILADEVVINRVNRSFTARDIRLGTFPYYVTGESAAGTRDEVTVFKARVTYGEPGPWQPTATADQITVSATGHRIRSDQAQIGIGSIRPLPFPKFQQSLSDPVWAFVTVTGGYRGSLGAFLDGGLHVPVLPGIRVGGDLGYFTARGMLVGPSETYSDPTDPDKLRGSFRSGYINDHGDKKTDVLGRRIGEERAFAEWQHQQQVTDDFTLTAQANWWKDSEVVRDFRPRQFFSVQEPDTFLEATKSGTNSFVSMFVRAAPNDFQRVQRRIPELRFEFLPTPLESGLVHRFNASIAMLQERPLPGSLFVARPPGSSVVSSSPSTIVDLYSLYGPPQPAPPFVAPSSSSSQIILGDEVLISSDPVHNVTGKAIDVSTGTVLLAEDLRTTRIDAYYAIERPIAPADWFTFTPLAGGRFTHYMNTHGAVVRNGSYTRVLGEVGFDAALRTSGAFDYKNEAWHIDGLRHLFTPRLSYRYIPEADRGRNEIPMIDRQTFSTYLQPLGLGEVRNIDDLHRTNTLRLSFDNVLQTRDPKTGPRDLLLFNVANDFRFFRRRGERDVSEIHTELAAMPARWLEFGFYNSFAPQTFTLREFNSGVTIRDGNAWSVRFANNFLRHQLEDYWIDGRARVNEQFDVLAQLRYDQRKHRFTEQSYGVIQNLGNTWRISYLVSLYSGRQRESSFGFSVQIDTVRF